MKICLSFFWSRYTRLYRHVEANEPIFTTTLLQCASRVSAND